MAVNLSFIGGAGWQFFDNKGKPLAGGKLYTYAAGTTTPLATYIDRTGGTANTNPIILDSAGRTPSQIWSTEGLLYKYVIKDSLDAQIRSWDNIGGSVVASDLAQDLSASSGASLVGYLPAGTGAVATTAEEKLRESVSVKDFGAVGDGVANDTVAIQAAIDSGASGVYFPTGTYYVTSEIALGNNCHLYTTDGATVFTNIGAGTTYANSVFVAFDRTNISITGLHIQGPAGGKSGVWTPAGTFDGVGACILFAGCTNVKITRTTTIFGGDPATGNGVGNIWLSSCVDATVSENSASLCDNGIVSDQWYTQLVTPDKSALYERGTVISNNVIYDCSGRGIAVETLDNNNGGSCVISGNSIFNCLSAGIQFRSAHGLTVIGNTINLANINRTALIIDTANGLYGIDGAASSSDIVVANNTIFNARTHGMQLYNASQLNVTGNIIKYDSTIGVSNTEMNYGILVQSTEANDLLNVIISSNIVEGSLLGGIRLSTASGFTGTSHAVLVDGNVVNHKTGTGIFCSYPIGISVKNNTIKPKTNYGGSIGINVNNSTGADVLGNSVYNCSTGLSYTTLTNVFSTQNKLENCSIAIYLEANAGGVSAEYIRGGAIGYSTASYGAGTAMNATGTVSTATTAKNTPSPSVRIKAQGSAIPAAGNWGRGDITENIAPTAIGDASFWSCIASGSPGTWAAMKLVAL